MERLDELEQLVWILTAIISLIEFYAMGMMTKKELPISILLSLLGPITLLCILLEKYEE